MRWLPLAFASICIVVAQNAHAQPSAKAASPYDPLRVSSPARETLELEVRDSDRDREIPLKVYLPNDQKPAAVVLFSHGLGGSRNGSTFLGTHWSSRGYVCVFLQHPGSDEAVWRDAPALRRMTVLRQAANAENFVARARDVVAVLDQLHQWNSDESSALYQRLDLEHVGMSGHSFGAVTTQAVSGQTQLNRALYTDARIKAALPMSPSLPSSGRPERAFASVKIPWLLMTGTHDDSPIGNSDPESRRLVYPALPAGSKYELVLDGAEHSVFTDHRLLNERQRRNPKHHQSILAISTAFWDAYLREDRQARAWLDGDGPREILDSADHWQHK